MNHHLWLHRAAVLCILLILSAALASVPALAGGPGPVAPPSGVLPEGNATPENWSFCEIFSRKMCSYGMYIAVGKPSADNVCSSWFFSEPMPDRTWNADTAKLARWREFDWEFIPGNTSTNVFEEIKAVGTATDGAISISSAPVFHYEGFQLQHPPLVDGPYTDDVLAKIAKRNWGGDAITVNRWGDLVTETSLVDNARKSCDYKPHWTSSDCWGWDNNGRGDSDYWKNGWTMSVWRMPAGTMELGYEDASGKATAIPTNMVDALHAAYKTTRKNTILAGIKGTTPSGTFLDVYSGYHTYTFVWTPDKVAYYIDAPEGGTKIEDLTPLWQMDSAAYPSLKSMGPQVPGWANTYLDYNDKPVNLADVRFILQIWVDGTGWSGPDPTGDTEILVKKIAYYPLKPSAAGRSESDFVRAEDTRILSLDFTDQDTWKSDTWRRLLQENFINLWDLHSGTKLKNNPELVQWVSDDGQTPASAALKMKCVRQTESPAPEFLRLTFAGISPGEKSKYCTAVVTGPNTYASYTPGGALNEAAFWANDKDLLTVTVTNSVSKASASAKFTVHKSPAGVWSWVYNSVDDPKHLLVANPSVPTQVNVYPYTSQSAAGCMSEGFDYTPDLVWQNTSTGKVSYAEASGEGDPVEIGGVTLRPGDELLAATQMDGAGMRDLLVRPKHKGHKLRVYTLQNNALLKKEICDVKKALEFRLASDLDWDGASEAILQSGDGSGSVWIARFHGLTKLKDYAEIFAAPGWTVVGVGDTDYDREFEILLQQMDQVEVADLQWTGGVPSLRSISAPITVGAGQVLGLADHDLDGWPDVYIQRPGGQVQILRFANGIPLNVIDARNPGPDALVILPQ